MVSALSLRDVLYTAAGIKAHNVANVTLDILLLMEFALNINIVGKMDT